MKLILRTIWIFKLFEMTSLVKIFYVFGRLLNTDHAFSVLRNYLSISFNIAYIIKHRSALIIMMSDTFFVMIYY